MAWSQCQLCARYTSPARCTLLPQVTVPTEPLLKSHIQTGETSTRPPITSSPMHRTSGESNGNPLQYSCLENPRDGGAWWAAVHGVAQSWTRLKRLSSSSKVLELNVIHQWRDCPMSFRIFLQLFSEISRELTTQKDLFLPSHLCPFYLDPKLNTAPSSSAISCYGYRGQHEERETLRREEERVPRSTVPEPCKTSPKRGGRQQRKQRQHNVIAALLIRLKKIGQDSNKGFAAEVYLWFWVGLILGAKKVRISESCLQDLWSDAVYFLMKVLWKI